MNKVEKGKLIISASKSLKEYQIGDAQIATFLHGTQRAGRVGLFLSAVRDLREASFDRVRTLAAMEGIDAFDLQARILPWLEALGLCRLESKNGAIEQFGSLILTYGQLLNAVADFYESLSPTEEDRGCLLALGMATALPSRESDILHELATLIGEEKGLTSVSLVKNFKLVDFRSGTGLPETLMFSSRVWTRSIGNASNLLSSLDSTDREVILFLVNRVRQYQGIPESILRGEAQEHGAGNLLNLALNIGLLDQTTIVMKGGQKRSFVTSPHLYSDLAEEFGEDMCDRVKIFLDSIRNGQHYGERSTGRILNPEALLRKLYNSGTIGPATAILTDYSLSEKAGIVRVTKDRSTGMGYMNLIQRDTVGKVLEIISTGFTDPGTRMNSSDIAEGYHFRSIEQSRSDLGKLSANMTEAENAIITQLRES